MKTASAQKFDQLVLEHRSIDFGIESEHDLEGGVNVCIRRVRSKIVGVSWGEDVAAENETRTEIGHVEAWLFLGELAESLGRDIYDDADTKDADSEFAAAVLYKFDTGLFDESTSRNAFYLHHIYIRPEYRGAGLAERVIRGCLLFHDLTRVGCVLLFVNSQFDLPENDPLKKGTRAAGDKKLEKLYRSMGFKRVKGQKGFMYANPELAAFWKAKPAATRETVGS
jgi:GNAT superfamily N-acetyltransferase